MSGKQAIEVRRFSTTSGGRGMPGGSSGFEGSWDELSQDWMEGIASRLASALGLVDRASAVGPSSGRGVL